MQDRVRAGGMSVVWRARDEILDRDVAVKVLSPAVAESPDVLRRIYSEARAAAGLRHPHVVEVYDYGETPDGDRVVPYVVMELIAGRSLADVLSGGALPWRSAVLIGAQVAAALAAAHARGIVHRDVKPGNVMVTAAGVKLVDFGISASIGEADMAEDQLLGTPAYLAPERLDGGDVRPATDVYALGLLLYFALVGRLPWRAATTTQMIRAHRYREPAALPPVPGLPLEVAELCHACLAKHPEDRPTAAEAAHALALVVGLPETALLLGGQATSAGADTTSTGAGTTVVAAPVSTALRYARSGRTVVLAGSIAAVLGTAGFTVWLSSGSSGGRQAVAAPMRQACAVDYALRSAAGGRLKAAVTIRNTGEAPVDAWQLRFTLPGQEVVRGWSGDWWQTGGEVRAAGGALSAGGSVETGFDAVYRDSTAVPTNFELNGVTCRPALSMATAEPVLPAPAGGKPSTPPVAAKPAVGRQGRASSAGSGKGQAKAKEHKDRSDTAHGRGRRRS